MAAYAVLVTASLPPFARAGSQIDVTVSAIGDARSLLGGTLVMTPLNAADGQIYAVAQGSIIAGGVTAEGEAETVTQGVPTAGLIPAGARVEREVAFDFTQMRDVRLALRNPDFTTAARLGEPLGYQAAALLLDQGKGRPRDPEAAADLLLRGVASDNGQAWSRIAGDTPQVSPDTIRAIRSRPVTSSASSASPALPMRRSCWPTSRSARSTCRCRRARRPPSTRRSLPRPSRASSPPASTTSTPR